MYIKLKELSDSGKLQGLVNAGIVSVTTLNHFNMYNMYLKQKDSRYVKNKTEAIRNVSIEFDTSRQLVSFAINKMEG